MKVGDHYFIIFLKFVLIFKNFYLIDFRIRFESNLKSLLQEFDVDLNLIAVFVLKKRQSCSPYLIPWAHSGIYITEDLKHSQYGKLKKKIEVYKIRLFQSYLDN